MHKTNRKAQSGRNLNRHRCRRAFLNNQKGTLLIALIMVMVLFGLLGAGLVSIFTSSNLNPISGNFAQRAYYNAESGIRFVKARYRSNGDKTIFTDTYSSFQTITLPDGGTVKVKTATLTPSSVLTTTTTAVGTGTSLAVASTTGFSTPVGFFRIGTDPNSTIYRYTGISGLTLTGIYPSTGTVASGATITTVQQTMFTSIGSFGNGFWTVSRTVVNQWPLSGTPGVAPAGAPPVPSVETGLDVNKWEISNATKIAAIGWGSLQNYADDGQLIAPDPFATSWGTFRYDNDGGCDGGGAIQVILGLDRFFLPYNYDFHAARNASSNQTLSYDAQTKIKIDGTLTNQFLAGLSVRAKSHPRFLLADVVDQFGVSYAMGHNWKFNLPDDVNPYLVFWRSVGNDFKLIAYKKLTAADGVVESFPGFYDSMNDTNGWTAENEKGVINGKMWEIVSPGSSYYHDASTSRYVNTIPDHSGSYLNRDWITNLVRAIPFPVGNPTATVSFWHKKGTYFHVSAYAYFQFDYEGDGTWDDLTAMQFTPGTSWTQASHTFTGNFGPNTKMRFRIKVLNGGRADFYVDQLAITVPNRLTITCGATLGIRVREKTSPRRNEFEIFFGSLADNGTGANTCATDINRAANALNQASWLPSSPINMLSSTNDKFTLASSDPSDTYASTNPWYWWYDTDGNYTNLGTGGGIGGVSTIAQGNTRTLEDGCQYTLETGGTLEPYAVITLVQIR